MNGVRGLNGVFAVVRVRFCFEVVLYLQFKGVGRSRIPISLGWRFTVDLVIPGFDVTRGVQS